MADGSRGGGGDLHAGTQRSQTKVVPHTLLLVSVECLASSVAVAEKERTESCALLPSFGPRGKDVNYFQLSSFGQV